MTARSLILATAIALLTAACSSQGGGGVDAPVATKVVIWTDNAWTQPIPAWGSPVRLNLPVPLASIVLTGAGGLGAFGAHEQPLIYEQLREWGIDISTGQVNRLLNETGIW